MDPAVDPQQVAALVLARPARAGTTRVLAVDGPSGSGKTTLAAGVADVLRRGGTGVAVVHVDDLYPGWDGLARIVPLLTGQVLQPLAARHEAVYRRWDWDADAWAERVVVPAAPVLVVEGVGCGARACAPHLSALVWVEAPEDVRMARGMARDGEAYRPHWQRWALAERAHFAAEGTRGRADAVLIT